MNLHSTKSSDFTMNGQNNMIRKHVAIMIRQGTGSAVAPKIFFTPCPQKIFKFFTTSPIAVRMFSQANSH